MKIKQTPEELKAVIAAVEAAGGRLFTREGCSAKYAAQRNLCGRTHYVDDDTLRWHKSRVLSAGILADGLLYRITESCALDMNNTSRGFRCVVFDVFGSTVERPALDATFTTSVAAVKACEKVEIDLVAHYREALTSKLHWIEQDGAKVKGALALIGQEAMAA